MAKEVFKCAHSDVLKVSNLLLMQNPKNNNKHPKEQIERLAKIIDFQGQRSPIVISKRSGFIVKGHGRLFALDKLGWENAAVDYQEYKTEAEEYADMTADNEIARWAEFDETKFLEDIKGIDLGDFDLLGLKDFKLDISEPLVPLTDEDAIPENVETRCKPGDIWNLGDHRLMCGDSTSIDAVEKLMNGEKADMVFTSPPYNFGKAGFEAKGKYDNSKDTDETEWFDLVSGFLSAWQTVSEYQFVNLQILSGNKIKIHEWLYQFRHRFVDQMALVKSTLPAIEINILNADFECLYIFRSVDNPKKHIKLGKEFRGTISNVYQMKRSSGEFSKAHRAGFDVSFPEYFIETFTNNTSKVADPFGGTGTTLIACEKTNRKCYMMELDPHYCDIIVKRWEEYTGKKAELANGPT